MNGLDGECHGIVYNLNGLVTGVYGTTYAPDTEITFFLGNLFASEKPESGPQVGGMVELMMKDIANVAALPKPKSCAITS